MTVKICSDGKNLGIETENDKVITVIQGKIVQLVATSCRNVSIRIEEGNAYYKNIRIPLNFPENELRMLKVLYIVKGDVSHEIFYYKNLVKIHIDSKLRNVKIAEELQFTRFCGNYGLLLPNYCFGNETYAIFGKNKDDVIFANEELKELLNDIRKVLLDLGFR